MKKVEKRIWRLSIIAMMIFIGWIPIKVNAADVIASGKCGVGVSWELNDEGTLTISGTGDMTNYSESDKSPWYDSYVKPYLDSEDGMITNVVIEDGVTNIGDYAFYNCRHMTGITVANTVVKVGNRSFSVCSSLPEISLPAVTNLGDYAFDSCTSLKTYTDNSYPIIFGKYVFNNCSNLTEVTFGSSQLGGNVDYTLFWGCSSLQTVKFSNEYIWGTYRRGLGGIVQQVLGNQKGEYVQRHIVFPAGSPTESISTTEYVYEISPYAFYNCDNLKNVNLGDAMEVIGDNAFRNCDNIQTLTLGKRVESIGAYAFAECREITSVTIPGCVGTIGEKAFEDCDKLETVYFRGNSPQLDGSIFTSGKAITAYYPENNPTWTQEVMDRCGGNTIWISYTPELSEFSDTYYISKLRETSFVYTGEEIEATVESVGKRINSSDSYYPYWLTPEVNYTTDYSENVMSGTATALIRGIGEYEGTIAKTFDIQPLVTAAEISGYYDGKSKNLDIKAEGDATLYFNTVTPLTYDNYLEEGTTTLPSRVSAGSTTVYYIAIPNNKPTKDSIVTGECQLVVEKGDQGLNAVINSPSIYIGETAQITASAKAGKITYSSNNSNIASVDENGIVTGVSEGKTKITVTAEETANYQSQQKVFEVTVSPHLEISILDCSIEVESGLVYTGEPVEADVIIEFDGITLTEYRDYTLAYNNNTNAGTATVTITGKGDYLGNTVKQFTIAKAPQNLNVNVSSTSIKVGSTANITLAGETQGAVTYASANRNIATVSRNGVVTGVAEGSVDITVTAAATDNYLEANKTITFNIVGDLVSTKDINECEITLSKSSYTYDGGNKKPTVTVKDGSNTLTESEDYTLTYPSNMSDAGTKAITVQGIGNYTGSQEISYEILKAEPTLSFVTATITKDRNDGSFTNLISATTDGTISYSTSDESVASVDTSTGEVTIQGKGTAVITAKASAGRNYKAGSASYELTVTEQESKQLTIDDLSYSFANNKGSFGYADNYNIPLERFQFLFGNTTKAKTYFEYKSEGKKWGGNCAGFSSTAALLNDFSSGISVDDFKSGASLVKELSPGDKTSKFDQMSVTTFMEVMQISQYTQLFKKEKDNHRVYTKEHLLTGKANLNNLYQTVKTEGKEGRPVLLAMYQSGLGHAVLAYGVKDISSTESQVLLYDNNFPMTERILTLKKDSAGNYTQWFYEIGSGHGIWGSDSKDSSISYVRYAVIKEIWDTSGDLKENLNIVTVNSRSVAIYETGDTSPVATVTRGELSTQNDNIQIVDDLSIERNDNEDILISLPVDGYRFVNLDDNIGDFSVSMTNNNLGAKVTTTANEVKIAVDDSCNLNAVFLDAGEDDTYSVTLNSTFGYDKDDVVVTGSGSADTMEISQSQGNINMINCDFSASLSIGGKKYDKYQIISSANAGGKITPSGEKVFLEGITQRYVITADEGYEIKNVIVDGESIENISGPVYTYTFRNISTNHTIEAVFKKIGSDDLGQASEIEESTQKSYQILADDVTAVTSKKAKSFKLKVKAPKNAKLRYSSNNKSVKVSTTGTVTVAKNYVGMAKIMVKVAATDQYPELAKTIKVTVNPAGTTIKKLKAAKKGKLTITWKRNSKVTGYEIAYSLSSDFKFSKKKQIKKNKTVKTIVKKLKKKKYYVRIRTYKTVSGKKFYSTWSKLKVVKAR